MAAVTDAKYALTPEQHNRELRRAVVAATVGTTIEWYDFLLYSTMAGLVFGKLFFPTEDPLTATLNAFAIYFVGFVAPSGQSSSAILATGSAASRRSSRL